MVLFLQDTFLFSGNTVEPQLTDTFFQPDGQKNIPYVDSCLKPLYNGHLLRWSEPIYLRVGYVFELCFSAAMI